MTRLKPGARLHSKAAGATKLKLVTSHAMGSRVYWWCEIEDAYMGTYEEGRLLADFREAPGFFEVGRVYRFPERTATYTVIAVYTNENPRSSKFKALAKVVETDGKDDIITLSTYDFDRMIEAE